MSDDFYTMVDSGDPAPDNEHITGVREERKEGEQTTTQAPKAMYAARIAVYDDMLSTPRVIVIDPQDVRTYLEETTNTVYQCMKEQGGHISLMVIREIVENFIHAHFAEPIISILDGGDTIRFADQGPRFRLWRYQRKQQDEALYPWNRSRVSHGAGVFGKRRRGRVHRGQHGQRHRGYGKPGP